MAGVHPLSWLRLGSPSSEAKPAPLGEISSCLPFDTPFSKARPASLLLAQHLGSSPRLIGNQRSSEIHLPIPKRKGKEPRCPGLIPPQMSSQLCDNKSQGETSCLNPRRSPHRPPERLLTNMRTDQARISQQIKAESPACLEIRTLLIFTLI